MSQDGYLMDDREYLVPWYFPDGRVVSVAVRRSIVKQLQDTDLQGEDAKALVTSLLLSAQSQPASVAERRSTY